MDHLSLFQLNQLIGQTLSTHMAPSYWVVAEIGEMRENQSGHCYLELVEKDEEKVTAKARATIWSHTYRNLSTWFEGMTGQALQPGLKILCNATIQHHEMYGLSLNIKDIDANFTLGERARRRKEIIDRLVADGVFEMNRELPEPIVPQRIAIISSPTAAGFGDFTDQLEHNPEGYHFELTLFKATMQGDSAPASIMAAMMQIYDRLDDFDVVAIIRGGGSQIDLDCFDHYDLATHIAQFPLPVLTGIGHERDETIADLVAYMQLKTPTAVAAFLINSMKTYDTLLDESFSVLQYHVNALLVMHHQKVDTLKERLKYAVSRAISQQDQQLALAEKTIELLNPIQLLKRGYSITTVGGKVVGKQKLKAGDELTTRTLEQSITSTIKHVKKV